MKLPPRLKAFHAWANHGWPTIWLQSIGGLLVLFGVGCLFRIEPGLFGLGVIFAFAEWLITDRFLSAAGWSCVVIGVLLGLATLPAQRRRFARFKKDQAMLQRQDWRK